MLEFTVLMASLMSVVAISIDAMMPALGIIGHDLHVMHPNQVQYIIGFVFLGMTIGELIAGPVSDAIGRKKVLYVGLLLFIVGSVISYVSQDITAMLIGRFIQGIGVAGPYMSAVSIVRDKYAGRDMARIMSLVMMIFIAMPAVAPTLGQGILLFASWRSIFLLYIIYALIIAVWLYVRLEETLAPTDRIPFSLYNIAHGLKEIASSKVTVNYTLCMGLIFGGFLGYLNSAQQVFQDQFHTGKLFTLYFSGLALVFGAASLYNSRIVERLGMRRICKRAAACVVMASAVFLIIEWAMPISLWIFIPYAAVLFFCFGLMVGNLNALAMEPMGHIAGIAASITGSAGSAISMVIGTIIGQAYNGTIMPLAFGFLIVAAIAWVIIKTTVIPVMLED